MNIFSKLAALTAITFISISINGGGFSQNPTIQSTAHALQGMQNCTVNLPTGINWPAQVGQTVPNLTVSCPTEAGVLPAPEMTRSAYAVIVSSGTSQPSQDLNYVGRVPLSNLPGGPVAQIFLGQQTIAR